MNIKLIQEEITIKLYEGKLVSEGIKVGIVCARFNEFIVSKLLSYGEMRRDLAVAIHQFAKRQMTWFRGMERRGVRIHWVEP